MTVNSSGTVVGHNDYYPFGMIMDGRSETSSADDRYKFIGKERDAESYCDYLGDRYYDSRLGRELSIDPYSDIAPSISPYVYALDNPIANYDYNGDSTVTTTFQGQQEHMTDVYTTTAQQDHNYISGWVNFNYWMNVFNLNGQYLEANIVRTSNGTRWYARRDMPMTIGVINLPVGPEGEEEAAAEAAAEVEKILKGEGEIGEVSTKIDELLSKAGKLERLKGGVKQGTVKGNIDEIFNSLTKEGEQIEPNRFKLPDGTVVTKYTSSTNATPTIGINRGGQLFKIRVE
jgi:RHS repeat-associated protein